MIRPDGNDTAVSTVLSKMYLPLIQSKDIYSDFAKGQQVLEFYVSHVNRGLYWRAYKARIQDLMIVNTMTQNDDESRNMSHDESVILPRSVVHGTVTRRSADRFFVVGKQGLVLKFLKLNSADSDSRNLL